MSQSKVIKFAESAETPQAGRNLLAERRKTVIQIGRDPYLLDLRAGVISSAGFLVESAAPEELDNQLATGQSAKIWIFCHSLAFHEFLALAASIRRTRPEDKLLRLGGLEEDPAPQHLVDHYLEPPTTVDDLLGAITSLG